MYADVDGTLAETDLLGPLRWLKYRELGFALYGFWSLGLVVKLPYWAVLERFNRMKAQESLYFEYGDMSVYETMEAAEGCYRMYFRPRIYPEALKKLKQLRSLNYKLMLVTEGLDILMEPFARDVKAELIAPKLAESGGRFTGGMATGVLVGERKANAVQAHAEEHGIDLANSFAFANSMDDLPLLECVGRPVVVNPSGSLARVAAERNWPIERWGRV